MTINFVGGTVLLGSKNLGTNVFKTLICIVGKPWSKQVVYSCLDFA